MGNIIIDLKQYIREKEVEWRRDITWSEINEATGIAESTLSRLMSGRSQRPDIGVLAKLCEFFKIPPGPVPFIVYQPEGKFFEWLKTQTGRDDPTGDFSSDSVKKSKERGNLLPIESDDLERWREHLIDFERLDSDVLDAFYDAWDEWSGERSRRVYFEGD